MADEIQKRAFIDQQLETRTESFELNREGGEGAAMNQSDTLSKMPAIRSDRNLSLALEVLIEVPDLKGSRMGRGRTQPPSQEAISRPRYVRTKRRLRREVRVAGCALLALMPLVSLCTIGSSSQPSRVVACSIADTIAGRNNLAATAPRDRAMEPASNASRSTRAVVLSVEPPALVPGNDTEVPVVFPGYVLPDDSLEDAAHEGS
jgi:hypothetical protein